MRSKSLTPAALKPSVHHVCKVTVYKDGRSCKLSKGGQCRNARNVPASYNPVSLFWKLDGADAAGIMVRVKSTLSLDQQGAPTKVAQRRTKSAPLQVFGLSQLLVKTNCVQSALESFLSKILHRTSLRSLHLL